MAPVVEIDDAAFQRVGHERSVGHEIQAVELTPYWAALDRMARTCRHSHDDQERIQQPAEPASIHEHRQVYVVRLFEVVIRIELLRAEAERMGENERARLGLATEATFRTFIVALRERRASAEQI
jgi:hypothetical protein